jgi:cyclopropane fatty-acyl-phospholipid synthase-like methyltransferase
VGPGDTVLDVGCGDGRVVVAAALRGACARGVELEVHVAAMAQRALTDWAAESAWTRSMAPAWRV